MNEIKKYYDFEDFIDELTKFNARTDKGFIKMKTYSSQFIVLVQIDRFKVEKEEDDE